MTALHDVELRGVTRRFGDVAAVDALDLAVVKGEFLSLLGPSGCGKTTTLRLIAGFERPDAGVVLIDGSDVSHLPPYRRPVNTVFQSYALFPHLSVLDNVAYGLKQRRIPRRDRRVRAQEMLELVHLRDVGTRRPRELSGGQQQRVALARALVMSPKVLLLDEPLGALDLQVRKALQIELKRIQETVGITFVYVTHDQEEALAMSDRVAVMNRGRIEQLAPPQEIYDTPGDRVRRRLHRRHELRRLARGAAGGAAREHPAHARRRGVGGHRRGPDGDRCRSAVRRPPGRRPGGAHPHAAVRRHGRRVARRGGARDGVMGARCGPRPDGRELTMNDHEQLLQRLEEQTVSRRGFVAGTTALLAAAALGRFPQSAFGAPEAGQLFYYNWGGYVNPKTYPAFTKATGIQVKKDFYTSNEALFAKLKGGARGYDLAVPTGYMVRILADAKLLEPIDWSKLPTVEKTIDPKFRKLPFDPKDTYSVAKDWGTTGFMYRSDLVKERPDDLASVRQPREDEVLGQGHRARRHPRVRRLDARDARLLVQQRQPEASSTRRRRSWSRSSPTSSRSRRRSTSSCSPRARP